MQSAESVRKTISMVNTLRPDRIAFYSYAHVPWTSPGQRRYTEADLPSDEVKRGLYEMGKEIFEQQGYTEIGMDHFALEEDALSIASRNGSLHRNFMGYSTTQTKLMVGLGCSSISDTWTAFGQNLKKVEDYQEAVGKGLFPIFKGHLLNREDLVLRQHILNLMCRLQTQWGESEQKTLALLDARERLKELAEDGLIRMEGDSVQIFDHAKPFVRNVCMALDARLWRNKPTTQIFSKTI